MIKVTGDTSGISKFIGTIDGIISAVEDPRFKGDFNNHLQSKIKKSFYVDTIAKKNSGDQSLYHVFEWGEVQGQVSDEPLFLLTSGNSRVGSTLGYVFLPSTEFVPLPDPARYGFDPDVASSLSRHVFQLKALVMETQTSVTVSPTWSKRLFIPWADAPKGYVFTKNPVSFNPGGRQSTGGFARWWREWFSTRAHMIAAEESEKVNKWLTATGNKQVRYLAGAVVDGEKVGGRYAKGRSTSIAYANAQAKKTKALVMSESKKMFDTDKWEDGPQ